MRMLIALAAIALIAAIPFSSGLAAGDTAAVVIGRVDAQSGRAQLDERLLRRQFSDGGPILHFLAMPFEDGYNLLRVGKDAAGRCRTEALRLSLSDGKLRLHEVRWFTTCSSPTCDDANDDGDPYSAGFAMCSPNHAKTGCDCVGSNGVSSCNFGIDVGGMGLATVLVSQP
jgi:hypothetical protein